MVGASPEITPKQREALAFILSRQQAVVVGPTLREVASALGVAMFAAQRRVDALRERGLVERTKTGRGLVLTPQGRMLT